MSDSTNGIRIDRSRCVLCGEPNECARVRAGERADEPCWCVAEAFPAALRARANAADAGASCICRRCLALDRSRSDADT